MPDDPQYWSNENLRGMCERHPDTLLVVPVEVVLRLLGPKELPLVDPTCGFPPTTVVEVRDEYDARIRERTILECAAWLQHWDADRAKMDMGVADALLEAMRPKK